MTILSDYLLHYFSANGLRYHCSKGKCEEGCRRTDSTCSMSDEDVLEYGVADVKEEKTTGTYMF